ncbi:RWD domain-containing protein 2A [Pseudocercospora fuligena]|uniref:RWD domain-containing protein 2A n=1 Tax=Pseudocercospora fuligena TaxID=685502 RepID=A0A8H6REG6_9PEZI|nr:RWD domain-containing protein 2A [Pseudocercospora fuligena]
MAIDHLPCDLLAYQLDQVDFLQAMFPEQDELSVDEQNQQLISNLRQWCEGIETAKSATVPEAVSLTLTLQILPEVGETRSISMYIEVPLTRNTIASEAPPLKVRVRQPDWLTKAELAQVVDGMPEDDTLSAIEHVREKASDYLSLRQESSITTTNASAQPIVRVWFYFPSISTREKRDDIVKYGPSYRLSGFLLAGKPGILCLEGGAQDIDDYMRFIKTESWGDIPSQHKKVSERYRETQDVVGSFEGMQEITDQLEKRGERSNRGDMRALESWLGERGLKTAFEKVLM